jgi:dTDP-4-dehydro-6-deoxy-alpha-D-glucopyranose 2,3-dehydratase
MNDSITTKDAQTIEGEASDAVAAAFEAWRHEILATNRFARESIPFADARGWAFDRGELVHHTGGFFQVVGIRARANHSELDGREQVIIRQRTTAINGFLLRRREGEVEVLVQGRVEPGNVGGVQAAPTVQSTEANYKRLHGGKPTVFLDPFLTGGPDGFVFDRLQSEEASRFHGKYNRNVARFLPAHDDDPELPLSFRFWTVRQLGQLIARDNTVNTDARSVLACIDWRTLAGDAGPFARGDGAVDALLARSLAVRGHDDTAGTTTAEVFERLSALRARLALTTEYVRLEDLANWAVTPEAILERRSERGFSVGMYRVRAAQREVASWDQPLIRSATRGRIVLLCRETRGVLCVLARMRAEIGYVEGVQLTSSVSVPPGEDERHDPLDRRLLDLAASPAGVVTLARAVQSEEGGRFDRDENLCEIVLLDGAADVPSSEDLCWITVGQAQDLARVPGALSMELRCVLSLLLTRL